MQYLYGSTLVLLRHLYGSVLHNASLAHQRHSLLIPHGSPIHTFYCYYILSAGKCTVLHSRLWPCAMPGMGRIARGVHKELIKYGPLKCFRMGTRKDRTLLG